MDALVNNNNCLLGKVVKSEDKWLIVFPDSKDMEEQLYALAVESLSHIVANPQKHGINEDIKITKPLSYSAFPILQKYGGLHVTLSNEPGDPNVFDGMPVSLTITGSTVWLSSYKSSISSDPNEISHGFFVLLVEFVGDLDKPKFTSEDPAHITIAQLVTK